MCILHTISDNYIWILTILESGYFLLYAAAIFNKLLPNILLIKLGGYSPFFRLLCRRKTKLI
jgi:hypothetical protein